MMDLHIPTLILCHVKRLVARCVESAFGTRVCRTSRYANADSEITNIRNALLGKNPPQSFSRRRSLLAIDACQQQSKLFAAETGRCVIVAQNFS